VEEKYNTCTR